jgi:hypothetical protein
LFSVNINDWISNFCTFFAMENATKRFYLPQIRSLTLSLLQHHHQASLLIKRHLIEFFYTCRRFLLWIFFSIWMGYLQYYLKLINFYWELKLLNCLYYFFAIINLYFKYILNFITPSIYFQKVHGKFFIYNQNYNKIYKKITQDEKILNSSIKQRMSGDINALWPSWIYKFNYITDWIQWCFLLTNTQ